MLGKMLVMVNDRLHTMLLSAMTSKLDVVTSKFLFNDMFAIFFSKMCSLLQSSYKCGFFAIHSLSARWCKLMLVVISSGWVILEVLFFCTRILIYVIYGFGQLLLNIVLRF